MTRPVSTRVTDALMAERAAGVLDYRGASSGVFRVVIHGRRRVYDTDRMASWLDGLYEGRGHGMPTTGYPPGDELAAMWQLLVDPDPVDARRVRVLTAMQARGVGIAAAADRIGRRRESVRLALRFGRPIVRKGTAPTLEVLEQAFGCDLAALYPPTKPTRRKPRPPALADCSSAPAEFVEWRRARALMWAHRRGVVRWDAPTDPDTARRARAYAVTDRGGATARVPGRHLVPWLQGLADGCGYEELAEAITDHRNPQHHVDDLPRVG